MFGESLRLKIQSQAVRVYDCLALYYFCKHERKDAAMKNGKDFLIVTNNPLVVACLDGYYQIKFLKESTYRDIFIKVRDLVYGGHTLYTHPLSGSVKPNETPYKSIVISKTPHKFSAEQAEIMANAMISCDKFTPRNRILSEKVLKDFQLIDYTLLAGALDFDAAAGLSKIQAQ